MDRFVKVKVTAVEDGASAYFYADDKDGDPCCTDCWSNPRDTCSVYYLDNLLHGWGHEFYWDQNGSDGYWYQYTVSASGKSSPRLEDLVSHSWTGSKKTMKYHDTLIKREVISFTFEKVEE